MLESADSSRRRELESRAYAPGGGLTDAEATELHALTDRGDARRRELQRRAFAPGGRLSDAEAAELRELSAAAAPETVAPAPELGPVSPSRGTGFDPETAGSPSPSRASRGLDPTAGSPKPSMGPEPDPEAESLSRARAPRGLEPTRSADGSGAWGGKGPGPDPATAGPDPAVGPDPAAADSEVAGPAAGSASLSRQRRWLVPVAAVLTLVLGFGAGWLAFGRDDTPAMTAEQRDAWVQLEASGDYDSGSVSLVGSQYGVDAWTATREDGEFECFTLTGGTDDIAQRGCASADRDATPYDLQASTVLDDDGGTTVWATLVKDTSGDPVVFMQRQVMSDSWDWRDQYNEAELEIAELLDSKGFQGDMLQVLGYDGETPVWLHQGNESCVLVATSTEVIAQACGGLDATQSLDVALPGAIYSVRWNDMRGPSLTIIRDPGAGVGVDCLGCPTIDDKTAEVVD